MSRLQIMEWWACECVYMGSASSVSQYDMKTRLRVFVYDFISLCTDLSYQLIVLKLRPYDNYDNRFTMNHQRAAYQFGLSHSLYSFLFALSIAVCTSKGHGKFVYAMKYSRTCHLNFYWFFDGTIKPMNLMPDPCFSSHHLNLFSQFVRNFRINFACLQQIKLNWIQFNLWVISICGLLCIHFPFNRFVCVYVMRLVDMDLFSGPFDFSIRRIKFECKEKIVSKTNNNGMERSVEFFIFSFSLCVS